MTASNNVSTFPRSPFAPTKRRVRFTPGCVAFLVALAFLCGAAIGVLI